MLKKIITDDETWVYGYDIETRVQSSQWKCFHRIAFRKVADDVGISFCSCQANFTDVLGMKHVAAKITPKLLNFKQKQRRRDIAQEMLINICSKRS